MPDRDLDALADRAHHTTHWLAGVRDILDTGDLCPAVRRFLYRDLPRLPLLLAHLWTAASARIQPVPDNDPHAAAQAWIRLVQLVNHVGFARIIAACDQAAGHRLEAQIQALLRDMAATGQATVALRRAAEELDAFGWPTNMAPGQAPSAGDGNTGWAPDIIGGNWPEEDQ